MAPPTTTAPLPLAPNRAALSNRISLLLASQSSVLKTMNLGRSENAPPAPSRRHKMLSVHDDNDNDMQPVRPNEGVGYVPEKTTVDSKRDDQALRGRLLGKRQKGNNAAAASSSRKGKFVVESESEEDEGRTALGKRKRPRRMLPPPQESHGDSVPRMGDDISKEMIATGHQEQVQGLDTDRDGTTGDNTTTTIVTSDTSAARDLPIRNSNDDPVKKKRKKNKKKNKAPITAKEGQ